MAIKILDWLEFVLKGIFGLARFMKKRIRKQQLEIGGVIHNYTYGYREEYKIYEGVK